MIESRAPREPLPHLVGSARPFVPVPDDGVARVCRVYDGDTLTLLCRVAGRLATLQLRVRGIDAPELRCAAQKKCACLVRDVVRALLLGREVRVVGDSLDKYGRLLGDVLLPGAANDETDTLSKFLMSRGLSRPYDGSSRLPWSPESLDAISTKAESVLATLKLPAGEV